MFARQAKTTEPMATLQLGLCANPGMYMQSRGCGLTSLQRRRNANRGSDVRTHFPVVDETAQTPRISGL